MSSDRVVVDRYIINTGVKVEFKLNPTDYIHFQYASGLITEAEAIQRLDGSRLDDGLISRMAKLVDCLSYTH